MVLTNLQRAHKSMDISIKRLVEENNQANKQLVSELRSEIDYRKNNGCCREK